MAMMMGRYSKGCLPCRTRRVKCGEERPSCQRCLRRGDLCTGYRDAASLVFHDQTEKTALRALRRSASQHDMRATTSLHVPSVPSSAPPVHGGGLMPSDQDVPDFLHSYVVQPCSTGSSQGFFEHLPSLWAEVHQQSRHSLRWAVLATSHASAAARSKSDALRAKALHCYGHALACLRDALAQPDRRPDDCNLMTIVLLDVFETHYLQEDPSKLAHAEGMAQFLRLKGPKRSYDDRQWSMFRLAHHRVQKAQLALDIPPPPESAAWAAALDEALPSARSERESLEIVQTRQRARALLQAYTAAGAPAAAVLAAIGEMRALDARAARWREHPAWRFRTVAAPAGRCPPFVELHRDLWMAYEWNYHRTARALLHAQMIECTDRLAATAAGEADVDVDAESLATGRRDSVAIIQTLADHVLATVPQTFGEVDAAGNPRDPDADAARDSGGRAAAAYFLLWPVKILKLSAHVRDAQRAQAARVFGEIRDATGMRAALGAASEI